MKILYDDLAFYLLHCEENNLEISFEKDCNHFVIDDDVGEFDYKDFYCITRELSKERVYDIVNIMKFDGHVITYDKYTCFISNNLNKYQLSMIVDCNAYVRDLSKKDEMDKVFASKLLEESLFYRYKIEVKLNKFTVYDTTFEGFNLIFSMFENIVFDLKNSCVVYNFVDSKEDLISYLKRNKTKGFCYENNYISTNIVESNNCNEFGFSNEGLEFEFDINLELKDGYYGVVNDYGNFVKISNSKDPEIEKLLRKGKLFSNHMNNVLNESDKLLSNPLLIKFLV